MKLFIALKLPEDIAQNLAEDRDRLCTMARRGNPSRTENLHVTLKFLGECDAALLPQIKHACDKVAASMAPFKVTLGAPDRFKRGFESILYAGIRAPHTALSLLARRLDRELAGLGFEREEAAYVPHITLARRARGLDEAAYEAAVLTEGHWVADSITLMESTRVEGKLAYVPLHGSPMAQPVRLTVDRIVEDQVVAEDEAGRPVTLVMTGVKAGDVLILSEGKYVADPSATQAKTEHIRSRFDALKKRMNPEEQQ